MIRFVNPEVLLALLVIPLLVYGYVKRQRMRGGSIRFSDLSAARLIVPSLMLRLRHALLVLRCLAIFCLVVGLARPQSGREGREVLSQGIDIIMAIDCSTSMEIEDLGHASRLEVSKLVVADFADGRVNDRLGLVVFAGEAYTQCPLTLDYGVFLSFLKEYASAAFLFAPGSEILGTTMLQFWVNGDSGPVAALAVIQIILTITFVVFARKLLGVKAYG